MLWLAALASIIVIAVFVYIGLAYYSHHYLQNHVQLIKTLKDYSVVDYSNAGQYLNFVIGLPLAAAVALIGAFVSFQVGHFTNTKDDVAILEFIDRISTSTFQGQRNIATTLTTIQACGDRVIKAVESVVKQEMQDLTADNFEQKIETIWTSLEPTQQEAFDEIQRQLTGLAQMHDRLSSQMHSALFLRDHERATAANWPVGRLQRILSDSSQAERIPILHGHEMICDLLTLTADRTGLDLVRAYLYSPAPPPSIEFIGAVLCSPLVKLEDGPHLSDGGQITGYTVNIGAAYLATLYQSLPDKSEMLSSLNNILDRVPRAAKKYLDAAGPCITTFASSDVVKEINAIQANPCRLIVLQTEDTEIIYDPEVHGDVRDWPIEAVEER
jgi:hypothetical protein